MKKCLLSIFLIFAMYFNLFSVIVSASDLSWNWDGWTPISTESDLRSIDNDPKGKYYLTNNIRLTSEWNAIVRFEGILDGNGHTIDNVSLTVDVGAGTSYAGFILDNFGTIRNLTIEFATSIPSSSNLYFGGFASLNSGLIVNCTSAGTIDLCDTSTIIRVGAITSQNYSGTLMLCNNTASITIAGDSFAGGIAGNNEGTIYHCCNSGEIAITSNGTSYIGGIAGITAKPIENCFNEGCVTVDSGVLTNTLVCTGGVVGTSTNNNASIDCCYNTGTITAYTACQLHLGGIVGMNSGNANQCYNSGVITAQSTRNSTNVDDSAGYTQYIGGISGEAAGSISDCYNVGAVKTSVRQGYTDRFFNVCQGGIVGESFSTLTDCFFFSSFSCSGTYYSKGGIAGFFGGSSVTNCYWCTSGATHQCGTDSVPNTDKLVSDDFTAQTNFSGFDFTDTWTMGTSYPVLRNTIAHSHSYSFVDGTVATCTTTGCMQHYYCSDCDSYFRDVNGAQVVAQDELHIPATQHSYTSYISNCDATCQADGTETSYCDYGCGTADTRTDEGSKIDHSFATYSSDNNATCLADGTKTAVCEHCDATDTIVDAGSQKAHNWQYTQEPYVQKCSNCASTQTVTEVSGTCGVDGDNLTWVLDEGTLTISGAGAMADYLTYRDYSPWYYYRNDITAIVIGSEVTSIGNAAFANCDNLKSVTVPSNIDAIGALAFYDCDVLSSVNIAEGVEAIGSSAFSTCNLLSDVNIGQGVKSLGNEAFNDCTSLKQLTLPDSVTDIGSSAFALSAVEEIIIPDGVQNIGSNAFRGCSVLTSVVIPKSVSSIGSGCFNECFTLKHIAVDDENLNYTSDEDGVLFNSSKTRLIVFPAGSEQKKYAIPDSVTEIDAGAFSFCKKLEELSLSDSVETIKEFTFFECSSLAEVVLPENITSIGDSAFGCCTSINKVYFRGNAPTFENGVFDAVEATVYYPTNNTTWSSDIMQQYGGTLTWEAYAFCEEHSWSDWTIVKEATEAEEGEKTRTCTVCGEEESQSIPKLEHVHSYSTEVTAPTCLEQGYTTYICTCGDSYISDYVSALGHAEETIPAIAATCTETGLTAGVKCSVCGKVLTEQEVVPVLDHTEETIPAVAATCTETGLTAGVKCSVCGKVLTAQEVVPVLDHTEETIPAVAASCTETGLTAGVKCSVCGEILTVQDTVPALGHSWGDWITVKEATEDEEGEKTRTCTACGEVESQSIPKLDHVHSYSTSVTAPTCEEQGYTIYTCACGDSYVSDYVNALGHTEEVVSGYAATCTKAGLTDGAKCSVCGEITKIQETIPALDHTEETIPAVAATCTETGLTAGVKCSVCGKVLTAQETVPALEHSWSDWTTVKEATETEEGEKTRTCTACGEEESQTIPKLDHVHNYSAAITTPTCEEQGYTTYTCACGDSHVSDYVNALGHTEVIDAAVAATCTEKGKTEGKHCSVCNEVIVAQTEVAALGHTEVLDAAVAPTCTATGLTEGTHCSVCNATIVAQTVVAKTEHTPVTDPAVEPTCTTTGLTEGSHCASCGATIVAQSTVPVKEHSWENVPGVFRQHCTSCQITREVDTITGQSDSVTWELTKDGTLTFYGDGTISDLSDLTPFADFIKKIVIESDVSSVQPGTFTEYTALESFEVSEENQNLASEDGVLFGKEASISLLSADSTLSERGMTVLLAYPKGRTDTSYTVPGTDVAPYAFAGNLYLTSVTLEENTKQIAESAFSGCTALKEANLPASLQAIGLDAFKDCPLDKVVYSGDSEAWEQVEVETTDAENNPIQKVEPVYFTVKAQWNMLHTTLSVVGIPADAEQIFVVFMSDAGQMIKIVCLTPQQITEGVDITDGEVSLKTCTAKILLVGEGLAPVMDSLIVD